MSRKTGWAFLQQEQHSHSVLIPVGMQFWQQNKNLHSWPRRGCLWHIPFNILVLGTSMRISPTIFFTYFKFSTSEFAKICHFEITKQKNFWGGAPPAYTPLPLALHPPTLNSYWRQCFVMQTRYHCRGQWKHHFCFMWDHRIISNTPQNWWHMGLYLDPTDWGSLVLANPLLWARGSFHSLTHCCA